MAEKVDDRLVSLIKFLFQVDLSERNLFCVYVKQCEKFFGPKEQEGKTCYANAIAAVIYLATRRIIGRDGGHPEFEDVRQEIIQQYGKDGAVTQQVLEDVCPRYRLRFQSVNAQGAFSAIAKKRPVVAIFELTEGEWDAFSAFYRNNPKGILTKNDVNIAHRQPGEATVGHAVFFVHFTEEYLLFVNSWGPEWGDKGLFRVEAPDVLGFEFFDVFWYKSDLSRDEKRAWKVCEDHLRADLARAEPKYDDEFKKTLPKEALRAMVNKNQFDDERSSVSTDDSGISADDSGCERSSVSIDDSGYSADDSGCERSSVSIDDSGCRKSRVSTSLSSEESLLSLILTMATNFKNKLW